MKTTNKTKISEHVGTVARGHAILTIQPFKYLVHTVEQFFYSAWKLALFLLMYYILKTLKQGVPQKYLWSHQSNQIYLSSAMKHN